MPTTKQHLSNAIRAALKWPYRAPRTDFPQAVSTRALTRAGLAAILLQAPAAGAITLGALEHDSAIGEPFRATAAVSLAAGEALTPGCITASPYKLGTLRLREPIQIKTPRAKQPGIYTVELATNKPLTEPMYELQLRIACPGTGTLTRSYIVMLDAPRGYSNIEADTGLVVAAPTPAPEPQPAAVPTLTQRVTEPRPAASSTAAQPASADTQAERPGNESVIPGQRYRVVSGDTLFGIAARLQERPAGTTWAAARLLYEANPAAFVNGDKGKLKLGAVLTIPGPEIVASLTPEPEFVAPTGPSAPTPERSLPARPALVRTEDTARIETEQKRAAVGADSADDPVPSALQEAPVTTADALASEPTTAPVTAEPAAPEPAQPAPRPNATVPWTPPQRVVSYPTVQPVSPLLAGIVGMLLGALFATLLFSARRIIDNIRHDHRSDAEPTRQFDTFADTDALDAYATAAAVDQPEDGAADSQHIELGEIADGTLQLSNMDTKDFPVEPSPFGTIEVEFSELDASARESLGFDPGEALGKTVEQPQLGESPRINLEGLGANLDLNRELEEMLEDFGPQDIDVDVGGPGEDHEDTDPDIDVEEDDEITHPRLDETNDADAIFNASQTDLPEGTDLEDEANQTLSIKSFGVGVDLDLKLTEQQDIDADLDFSLDTHTMRNDSDAKD